MRSHWVSGIGGLSSGKHAKGRIAGRLTAGAQDGQDTSTRPRLQRLAQPVVRVCPKHSCNVLSCEIYAAFLRRMRPYYSYHLRQEPRWTIWQIAHEANFQAIKGQLENDAARRVPFRDMGLGIRAPDPCRQDRLHALPRQPGMTGVDVTGPVPALSQDRGASVQAVPRPEPPVTRGRRGRLVDPQDGALGAKAASVAAESGNRFSIWARPPRARIRPAVPTHGGPIRIGRPPTPRDTRARHPAPRFHSDFNVVCARSFSTLHPCLPFSGR